jgi:broad specificity phosphatase PhoE
MKIFLIRHGETTGDLEDRYGGNYDDHLTLRGKEQLAETASKLKGKDIQIIFSSNLIRAKESAQIIQKELGCDLQVVEGIEERNYGVLAGLTKAEALERYPEAVEAHKNPENTDPEGESLVDFQNRAFEAFKNLFSKDYATVAIVSHGGPLKQVLKYFNMPLPPKIGDGEIIEVTI